MLEFVAVPRPWGGRDRHVQVYSHIPRKVHPSDGMGRDGMGWDRESLTSVCMTSCSLVKFLCEYAIRCTLVRSSLPKRCTVFQVIRVIHLIHQIQITLLACKVPCQRCNIVLSAQCQITTLSLPPVMSVPHGEKCAQARCLGYSCMTKSETWKI